MRGMLRFWNKDEAAAEVNDVVDFALNLVKELSGGIDIDIEFGLSLLDDSGDGDIWDCCLEVRRVL